MDDNLDQEIGASSSGLVVSEHARKSLQIACKWARFLAIIGFMANAIVFIRGMIAFKTAATSFGYFKGYFFGTGVGMVIVSVVLLFPTIYLLRFATNVKRSLADDDQIDLEVGLDYLKSLFRYMGIYTIVMLGIYCLLLIFILVTQLLI